jgi:tetratricopeptide (TPR) repeat protein
VHYKLAKLYFEQKEWAKCEDSIESCNNILRRYFKVEVLQGWLTLERPDKDPDRYIKTARDHFNNVLKNDSLTKHKEKQCYLGLSKCKELEGNNTDAIINARKALNINPFDNDIRENLALLYVRTGEIKKAIEQYKMILKEDKNNARIYLEIGTLFIFLNLQQKGKKYIQ